MAHLRRGGNNVFTQAAPAPNRPRRPAHTSACSAGIGKTDARNRRASPTVTLRLSTPRSANDCLIATRAIFAGAPLLHHDRDFNLIASVEPTLVLVAAEN
jgi:predicted nucleic acid-binding protein